ncbi:hypothetical protein ACF0H5_007594 [Mactra antiquata]
MQSRIQPTTIRCYTSSVDHTSNSFRMPSRESTLRKEDAFESKGVILLIVCGLYAVFLFILARLCSYAFSSLTSSVKSVFIKRQMTEVTKVVRISKSSVPQTQLTQKTEVRDPVRTLCHG